MTEAEWLACDDVAAMLAHLRSSYTGVYHWVSDRRLRLFACACCRQVWDGAECPRCDGQRPWQYQPGEAGCLTCSSTGKVGGLTDPRSRRAVEVAERFADGLVDAGVLHVAHGDARSAWEERDNAAGLACYASTTGDVAGAVSRIVRRHLIDVPPPAAQAALARCVFGNPFRPVTLCGSCVGGRRFDAPCADCGLIRCRDDGLIVKLARAAYDDRGGETCGRCGGGRRVSSDRPFRYTEDCPDCDAGRVAATGHLDNERLAVLADAAQEAGCEDAQLLGHLRSPGPHVRGCVAVDLILGKT